MVVAASIRRTTRAPRRRAHVPGQLIVRFAQDALLPIALPFAAGALPLRRALAVLPEAVKAPLEFLARNAGLSRVASLFGPRVTARVGDDAAMQPAARVIAGAAAAPVPALAGVNVIELAPGAIDAALLKRLATAPGVEVVEPMPARWLLATSQPDPRVNLQWALRAIRWFEAKASAIDASAVTVAVLDTGIDTAHPDLDGVIASYVDNGFGKRDVLGHGTHVAGIVAARIDNAVGIAGVSRARLAIWKIVPDKPKIDAPIDDDEDAEDEDDGTFYIDGEAYLRSLGGVLEARTRVLNLSLGGTAKSKTEALIFQTMANAGTVICAAIGNEYEDGNPTEYPAAYEDVIAVGAIDALRRRAGFSNTGRHLHVMAPGTQVLSTLPLKASRYRDRSEYDTWDGTSMACPHVAAATALLLAREPRLTATDVRARLAASAAKVPAMRGARHTRTYGHGVLDLDALLRGR